MNRVYTLDCTLRDGGYVNNWQFGKGKIKKIIHGVMKTGVEFVELGFMRDEAYSPERAVFPHIADAEALIDHSEAKIATFIEMANYYPLHLLKECQGLVSMIRYSFWKRKLQEAYEYAKQIVEKGYELFVQPTRVEQYTEQSFADMICLFSKLSPKAIYIVDTFGVLSSQELEKYAVIADKYLPEEILLGYHAHNNMQQAMANAIHLCNLGLKHDLVVDASVFGMGRGAGNLPEEMWLEFANSRLGKAYQPEGCYEVYDTCLKDIYNRHPWGYSMAYYQTAKHRANPNYATWMMQRGMPMLKIKEVLDSMPYDEMIVFSEDNIKKYVDKVEGR